MSKFSTMFHLLKTPGKMIIPLANMGLLNWIPDRPYLKMAYRGEMGKKLNLDNPQTFNEKIQWLKLYDRKPSYHLLVDKYEIKNYIAETIGKQYVIPCIGLWNSPDEIPYDELPNQFVLKCTHDSGSVVICRNKSTFDKKKSIQKLKEHYNKSIYWFGREWPYKGVKPRIIAEQYLEGGEKGLTDYKVLCFHGEPKLIEVHQGRMTAHHTQDFYTTDWKRTEIEQVTEPKADLLIDVPKQLSLMLKLSEQLSKEFIHIRIDWFLHKDALYFGEITFYDGSGFSAFVDDKYDYEIGQWIHLPQIRK